MTKIIKRKKKLIKTQPFAADIFILICNDFYIGKTKRRLHDRKTEHFKALINGHRTSALADHVTSTGHSLKWDHFEVLGKGRSDTQCKIKETLLIKDLKPTLNEYVSSERLCPY